MYNKKKTYGRTDIELIFGIRRAESCQCWRPQRSTNPSDLKRSANHGPSISSTTKQDIERTLINLWNLGRLNAPGSRSNNWAVEQRWCHRWRQIPVLKTGDDRLDHYLNVVNGTLLVLHKGGRCTVGPATFWSGFKRAVRFDGDGVSLWVLTLAKPEKNSWLMKW